MNTRFESLHAEPAGLAMPPLPTLGTGQGAAMPDAPAPGAGAKLPRVARMALSLLAGIEHGRLVLGTPEGMTLSFGQGQPVATLRLDDWGVLREAIARGDSGFAQAWIDGRWHTDDLATLLDVLVRNRAAIERLVYGNALARLALRVRHLLNRNSRAGSRRNIAAHYDLGNAFYRLWLDRSLTYSSALFDDATRAGTEAALARGDVHAALAALEQAQHAKYARVLDELDLPAGARVLEIGCGWGGMAEAAAGRGLRLTGLTLSVEQLRFARERLVRATPRPELKLQDYRDEAGTYDGIASIEMFEAVGEAYWPTYFRTLRERLAPGGRAVVQTIVIDDALFERYRRGTDFIQQHVFPGGMLPSPSAFERQARAAGLVVRRSHGFGRDYALTLRAWRHAFMARIDGVRAQGFDGRFERLWEFYLAYCEAAFEQRNCDVVQYTLERAR